MLSIRRASGKDAGIASAIRRAAILAECADAYPQDLLQRWVDNSIRDELLTDPANEFYVLERDGEVVATGMLNTSTGRLDAIFVAPHATRMGLARRMIEHLEQRAVALGLSQLVLDSTLNATGFYRKLGFAGEQESVYESPKGITLACVPMEKVLQSDD